MNSLNNFLSFMMGKIGYKHCIQDGISKYYNKDFEVILYKDKKNEHALIIDKRDVNKPIIYNDINIAMSKLCTA
jgi:hypothetical protein